MIFSDHQAHCRLSNLLLITSFHTHLSLCLRQSFHDLVCRHITLSVSTTMNIGDCHILQEDMTQRETSSVAYVKFNRPYVHIAPDNRKLCISTASHLDRKVRLLKDCPSRIERRRGGHGGRCKLVLASRDHLQVPETHSKEQHWLESIYTFITSTRVLGDSEIDLIARSAFLYKS